MVVMILTWFSLYVGWGSYMNIGMYDSFCRYGEFVLLGWSTVDLLG